MLDSINSPFLFIRQYLSHKWSRRGLSKKIFFGCQIVSLHFKNYYVDTKLRRVYSLSGGAVSASNEEIGLIINFMVATELLEICSRGRPSSALSVHECKLIMSKFTE